MADITMCSGENCNLKDNCYRYLASPSNRQSYFAEKINESFDNCKQYLDYENYTKSEYYGSIGDY